jgi:DNA-binding response OmpR family regulator
MINILLIEDDQSLRENTEELLSLEGYNVLTAAHGKEGVRLAFNNSIDLVICDIMMPELDGYGVLEALSKNKETQGIPFIFLSAKTEVRQIRQGMALGADDYLTKPCSIEDLVAAIESRLARVALLKKIPGGGNSEMKRNDSIAVAMESLHQLKNYIYDEGEVFSIEKGDSVYEEGKMPRNFYLVIEGVVKTHRMDERGKELITGLHQPDSFLGLHALAHETVYDETATALEPLKIAAISKDAIKEILINNQEITLELLDNVSHKLSEAKNQLLHMAYSSVRKKTAMTILEFDQILGMRRDRTIKIARADLASVAGIAPESLIRTLSQFKQEGLIDIEGRHIKVIDRARLESVQ